MDFEDSSVPYRAFLRSGSYPALSQRVLRSGTVLAQAAGWFAVVVTAASAGYTLTQRFTTPSAAATDASIVRPAPRTARVSSLGEPDQASPEPEYALAGEGAERRGDKAPGARKRTGAFAQTTQPGAAAGAADAPDPQSSAAVAHASGAQSVAAGAAYASGTQPTAAALKSSPLSRPGAGAVAPEQGTAGVAQSPFARSAEAMVPGQGMPPTAAGVTQSPFAQSAGAIASGQGAPPTAAGVTQSPFARSAGAIAPGQGMPPAAAGVAQSPFARSAGAIASGQGTPPAAAGVTPSPFWRPGAAFASAQGLQPTAAGVASSPFARSGQEVQASVTQSPFTRSAVAASESSQPPQNAAPDGTPEDTETAEIERARTPGAVRALTQPAQEGGSDDAESSARVAAPALPDPIDAVLRESVERSRATALARKQMPSPVADKAQPAPPQPELTPVPVAARPQLLASTRIDSVNVRGPLSAAQLRRGVERLRPTLSECYAEAAQRAGHHRSAQVRVNVTIDEAGRIKSQPQVEGAQLPGFGDCVSSTMSRLVCQAPDTGTARAAIVLGFRPER